MCTHDRSWRLVAPLAQLCFHVESCLRVMFVLRLHGWSRCVSFGGFVFLAHGAFACAHGKQCDMLMFMFLIVCVVCRTSERR
jgi:hypothetical protein